MAAVPQDLSNMAAAFTGLPMGDLIGGPLMAAAKAQKELAEIGTKYVLETGFALKEGSTLEAPIYVQRNLEFEVSRPVISVAEDGTMTTAEGSPLTSSLTVPLLCCVPIQSLGVTLVDITFDMEVKSSYSNTEKNESAKESKSEGSFSATAGWAVVLTR